MSWESEAMTLPEDPVLLDELKNEFKRIPPLVWQHLWERFCGISFDFDGNNNVTNFREGRRQVVYYMLLLADKLNFEEMEAVWQKVKAQKKMRH